VINISAPTKLVDTAAGVAAAADASDAGKAKQASSILTVDVLGMGDDGASLPPTAAGNSDAAAAKAKEKRLKDTDAK
jgi:6-phosphogluconolactonase/glucosamine-6-phosphate isomerase/deaminase